MARSRRGRGEGSIFQRKDGRWVGRVSLGRGGDGRRKQRTVYGRTKAQVQQKLLAIQQHASEGTLADINKAALSQYLSHWLEHRQLKPTTRERYEQLVRLHIIPHIGGVQLSKLNATHIEMMHAQCRSAGLSGRTCQFIHTVLQKALSDAVRKGLIAFNVCERVEKPKPDKQEQNAMTQTQAVAFLESVSEHRLCALFLLALSTGMRQGELLGLYWSDIDFDAMRLSVNRTHVEVKGECDVNRPKTEGSARTIHLPAMAIEALAVHRKAMMTAGFAGRDRVFVDKKGGPIRRRNLLRSFKLLLSKAELPEMRFHDLRHTAATLLLSENENPKAVAAVLGHSKVTTTLQIYGHVSGDRQKQTSHRLAGMLSSKTG